jgi:hypothetical protein
MFARIIEGWQRMTLGAKIRRIIAIVGTAVAVWALTPYFYSTRADDAFPVVAVEATAIAPTNMPPTAIPPTVVPTAVEPTMAPTVQMARQVVATPIPPTDVPPTAIPPTDVPPTAIPPTPVPPTAVPAEPVALLQGNFTRIDALHGASGQAVIYRLPDNRLLLRLEGFEATNGPDLFIGLGGHPMPRSNAELFDNGYLELARLKASSGNQNYELPADLDINRFRSVTIYCRAFSVMFSSAALE